MLFEKTENTRSTVRNQCDEVPADSWETVREFLNIMFNDEDKDEFVVLSLAGTQPIRYVQSAWTKNGLVVQLGIDEENGTRLVEKFCSEEECVKIFHEFYDTSNVSNIKEYSEVQFL